MTVGTPPPPPPPPDAGCGWRSLSSTSRAAPCSSSTARRWSGPEPTSAPCSPSSAPSSSSSCSTSARSVSGGKGVTGQWGEGRDGEVLFFLFVCFLLGRLGGRIGDVWLLSYNPRRIDPSSRRRPTLNDVCSYGDGISFNGLFDNLRNVHFCMLFCWLSM